MSDFAAGDEYGEGSRARPWATTRQFTARPLSFSPGYESSVYGDHSHGTPELPISSAPRTRLGADDGHSSPGDVDEHVALTSAHQHDATLRLLATYRTHAANLEARLNGGVSRPSVTLVRMMEEEDRLRANSLRQLERDTSSRVRASARMDVGDMIAAQKKEAQALRTAMSSEVRASAYEREKERDKDREVEYLRQENARLRSTLRDETLSLQTRLRELGRAGALLAGAPQPVPTADAEVQQILETDLWGAVNAKLQSVIDRRLREEQRRTADLLAEQRQLKSDNERLGRDLDATTALLRRLQNEDLKDYAQLREQREADRRAIEDLKAAKDAIGVEHDKVAEVCRGLQQLLDTTNALLRRAVSEVDGYTQKAEGATVLRAKAEEAFAAAAREIEALRISIAASESALRETTERLRDEQERARGLEVTSREVPILRGSLAAAESARRETEERAAAELAAGAQRLQEERQRAAQEARALQAKVAFLSKAESAIKESISEVRNTCNVLHTLLSRPDAAITAQ